MIKQLLSTALLAVSLNTNPQRLISSSIESFGTYTLSLSETNDSLSADTPFGDIEDSSAVLNDGYYTFSVEDEQNANIEVFGAISSDRSWGTIGIYWYFSTQAECYSFRTNYMLPVYQSFTSDVMYEDGDYPPESTQEGWRVGLGFACDEFNEGGCYVTFRVGSELYSVTKTFNHCHNSGNPSYVVPDRFTSGTLSNPYTIYVLADDGYFFKRDGSSYSFSSGVVVTNVDYGANPSGEHLAYSSEMKITFSMPASDVSMTFTASAITLADANALYNQGYQDAKATYENTNQFAWLKNIWTGMAGFFAIEILPNISLGFLAFAPLLVVAIIAIVRILKHD